MSTHAIAVPLRGMVVFPGMVRSIPVGRPSSVEGIERHLEHDTPLVLVPQVDPEEEDPTTARIPTIATLRDSASLCVTWLSLKAQSAHTLTLPSTQQRKTVQILYWDRGMLLSTPRGGHAGAVSAGLRQLASDFGEQWRRDQR